MLSAFFFCTRTLLSQFTVKGHRCVLIILFGFAAASAYMPMMFFFYPRQTYTHTHYNKYFKFIFTIISKCTRLLQSHAIWYAAICTASHSPRIYCTHPHLYAYFVYIYGIGKLRGVRWVRAPLTQRNECWWNLHTHFQPYITNVLCVFVVSLQPKSNRARNKHKRNIKNVWMA